MKNEEKSVLFVEFDPIKYEKLFKISKEYSFNFILFNRRRSSIWNLKSYNIIKNSNCIIANADHEEKHILIATTTSNKIGDFLIKNRENYEETILKICQSLENMGKEVIIKIHPFEDEEYVTELVKKLNPKIKVIKKGDIIPLIKSCEVFISLDMSTTILEAQLLKKPVITINTGKVPYNDESSIFKSNSCDRVKIEEFEKTITKIIHDNDYKLDLIRRGTDFFNEYVSNQGNASKKLFSCLENSND